MPERVAGQYTITNAGTGTLAGGVTGVQGNYLDLSSQGTTGADVSVGDYLYNQLPDQSVWRWEITNITNASPLTIDVVQADDVSTFPAAFNSAPITPATQAIAGRFANNSGFVMSHEVYQISDALTQAINSANVLDIESGTNIMTGNQTQTGTRVHDLGGFSQNWNDIGDFSITSTQGVGDFNVQDFDQVLMTTKSVSGDQNGFFYMRTGDTGFNQFRLDMNNNADGESSRFDLSPGSAFFACDLGGGEISTFHMNENESESRVSMNTNSASGGFCNLTLDPTPQSAGSTMVSLTASDPVSGTGSRISLSPQDNTGFPSLGDVNISGSDIAFSNVGNTPGPFLKINQNFGNTDPSPTNLTAKLYCKSSELWAMDGAGNATQLSPHDEAGDWVYYSENVKTGKKVKIDMERFFREKFPEFMSEA